METDKQSSPTPECGSAKIARRSQKQESDLILVRPFPLEVQVQHLIAFAAEYVVHLRGQPERCITIYGSPPCVHSGGCLQVMSRKKLLRPLTGLSTVAVVHPIELDHDLPLVFKVAGRNRTIQRGIPGAHPVALVACLRAPCRSNGQNNNDRRAARRLNQ